MSTRGKKAIAWGYEPVNDWEELFRRSVQRCRPKLVEELGDEFEAYLQVRAADAIRMYDRLIEQGTPAEVARERAIADLLSVDLDEEFVRKVRPDRMGSTVTLPQLRPVPAYILPPLAHA